jgi:hypothetical protein
MSYAQPESIIVAAVVGLLAGTHTAIWGMHKDAIHEGFDPRRFARSLILGAFAGALVQLALRLPVPQPGALVLLFGLAYAVERGIVEVWKTFLREEDQSKYTIPTQFSVRGIPVVDRRTRLTAGAAWLIGVALCLVAVAGMEPVSGVGDSMKLVVAGLVAGGIIAAGGAWRDAPVEGFQPHKFLRSPLLAAAFALLLGRLTENYLYVAAAAIGFERAAAETYKTFFLVSKTAGKFDGKPVLFPEMLRRRRYFVPAYVAIWIAVVAAGALAFQSP